MQEIFEAQKDTFVYPKLLTVEEQKQKLKCPHKIVALSVCIDPKCQVAGLMCRDPRCQCMKRHYKCHHIQIDRVLDSIQRHQKQIPQEVNQFYIMTHQIVSRMCEDLVKILSKLQLERNYFGLSEKELSLMKLINQQKNDKISGKIVSELEETFETKTSFMIESHEEILANFQKTRPVFDYLCKQIEQNFTKFNIRKSKSDEKKKCKFPLCKWQQERERQYEWQHQRYHERQRQREGQYECQHQRYHERQQERQRKRKMEMEMKKKMEMEMEMEMEKQKLKKKEIQLKVNLQQMEKLRKVQVKKLKEVEELKKKINEMEMEKQWERKKDKILLNSSRILNQSNNNKAIQKWLQQTFNKNEFSSKLLFRASEHNFSSAEFHKHCDGVGNTLVIVKTEFDKVIGGFTPNKWHSENKWVDDETRKSFLFSLTLEEKYTCTKPKYSIVCNKDYGPTFGGGHDLYLSDNAHNSGESYANFPHSFNLNVNDNNQYERSQESYTLFSGATRNHKFNVKQYEVYQIKGT